MRYGCKKPIIFILIAMALLLTGCGNKAKEVEYITTDTSEKGIHGIDSFPGMDNSKRVWDDQYAIGDTPVEMNVRNIYYDQNPIYQRRIIPIDRNDIRGDIIASQIFGDSTSVLKRDITENDPYLLVRFCKAFQAVFHRERLEIDKNGVAVSYIFDEVPTWEDGADFFYHTYEGMIEGVKYWLFIGYREDKRILSVSMWPYNPGEVIGKQDFDNMGLFDQYNDIVLSDGGSMYQRMFSRNRTEMNETRLNEKVEQFSIEKLMMKIDKYDCKVALGDNYFKAIYFCSGDLSKQRYDEAVIDGYAVYCSATKNHYEASGWLEGFERYINDEKTETDVYDERGLYDNFGVLYVYEGGVIGCNLQYSFIDEGGENAEILDFKGTQEAFEKNIRSHLETEGIKGKLVTCRNMRLLSFPDQLEEDGMLLIPVWQFELLIDDQQVFAYVYQSAVDGSLISIQYL